MLESRAHAEDQLQQLETLIKMRKKALELRGKDSGENRPVDKMDDAPDMEHEVIDLTEEMDDSP